MNSLGPTTSLVLAWTLIGVFWMLGIGMLLFSLVMFKDFWRR